MQTSAQPSNPRRPPAHLSVSLRQNGSGNSGQVAEPAIKRHSSSVVAPTRNTSDDSNNSRDGAQNWFDRSNKRPAIRLDQRFTDNESPYFLRHHSSSSTSNVVSESSPNHHAGRALHPQHLLPALQNSVSKDSSTGDFRSVIDDLTIENRKLKEKLRKYEAAYSSHLEKDILFEVKVHGLAARKKRELEETLRSFAASVNGRSDTSPKHLSRDTPQHASIPSKNNSLSSSVSRPVDSAYASMSNSGPTQSHDSRLSGAHRNTHHKESNKDQIQSFLHNIPEGLLPKHAIAMTERQKKKMVVRRLEQLFTGKRVSAIGDHSQPLQQQRVSESAARADQAANSKSTSMEGVREAHILPYEMEVDNRKAKHDDDSGHEMADSRDRSDSATESSPDSFEQRPTRPLDLDPDRAQIPAENVEYLKHLGVSAPSFERGISGDVEADADGWIYLNLLINMAQLHIINVTPDFVRSAVADVSDRFQLSRDGRKIRWRGGTNGTRFSSDSGNSSGKNGSPMDSDSPDGRNQKRRKIDVGRFASASINNNKKESTKAAPHNPLYYKPLFHHRNSSTEESSSCDDSESPLEHETGLVSRVPHLRSRGSHSMSGRRTRRRNDGPIVFYSNAQFCTDLSGDRGTISTPIHETGVGLDGYSNHTQNALGCTPRKDAPSLSRTPSGSFMPFRPFKDYSKGFDPFLTNETRPKTPDLLVDDESDLDMSLGWAPNQSALNKAPMRFDASGLGGTQPEDHFMVTVETRRTILNNDTHTKLSKFSAPRPGSKKILHTIPKGSLRMFQQEDRSNPEGIISGLASLQASSPPSAQHPEDLPVQSEIVSAKFFRLQRSSLPPAMGYHAMFSSSDSDSDGGSVASSFSGISHLRKQKAFGASAHPAPESVDMEQDSGEMQDVEDDVEDDSDESIDMLATARVADPQTVAEREEEFERQARQKLEELPTGSSAAAVEGGSGFPSPATESMGSDDDDDDDDGDSD